MRPLVRSVAMGCTVSFRFVAAIRWVAAGTLIAFSAWGTPSNGDPPTGATRFPFVIPADDGTRSAFDRSGLLDAPAGKHGFVESRDGHFYLGEDRIRFWGMNVCFDANFPTHDAADKIAEHLARLGCNAVRFHHMDMQDAPGGIWGGYDAEGKRFFDSERVDRLDYFLARLAEKGIYADLNLHVSRTLGEEDGFPTMSGGPWWSTFNKWVMYYDPDVQAELKRYCRDLLTHRNPYRDDLRRADDPSIALVEMLNENYFSEQGYAIASQLPERFRLSLITKWNTWLEQQYGDRDGAIASWKKRQPKPGDFLIRPVPFAAGPGPWKITVGAGKVARKFGVEGPTKNRASEISPSNPGGAKTKPSVFAIRLTPQRTEDQMYKMQLMRTGLSIRAGVPLTLSYWVRSDQVRSYQHEISTNPGEWRSLGLFQVLESSPEWTYVSRTFVPDESVEEQVNVVFSFANSTIPLEIAGVTLREGSGSRFLPREKMEVGGRLGIPGEGWPSAAHVDMKRFMRETEMAWVAELKGYLRNVIGVKVPITASQVNYHTPEVNVRLNDFVDLHNYWHHPLFPSGGEWNPEKWTVGNEPMEADPRRSKWPANSLLMRTGWRYQNKPFTLSEWSYPEPSPYSAGCVPMAAMLGALQDWDAVFFFQYDASFDETAWRRDHTTDFFSFNGQPVKLAAFATFANVFLRGDLAPLADERVHPIAQPADGVWGLKYRLSVSASASTPSLTEVNNETVLASTDQRVIWKSDPPKTGHLVLNTQATRGVWGTIGNQSFEVGNAKWRVGSLDPDYGMLIVSSADGTSIEQSKSLMLFAGTSVENQAMGWNDNRDSVGRQWGTGPTTVVGMDATLEIPTDAKQGFVWALDGTGRRQGEISSEIQNGALRFQITPASRTIWYEILLR